MRIFHAVLFSLALAESTFASTNLICGHSEKKIPFVKDVGLNVNLHNGIAELAGGKMEKLIVKSKSRSSMTYISETGKTFTVSANLVKKRRTHGILKQNGAPASVCFLQ